MELTVITTLYIALSILITPSASHQTPLLSSHEHVNDIGLPLTKLPRKLRPFEDPTVKSFENKDIIPDTTQEGALPGEVLHKGMLHGRKGTRQEWVEGNTWEFYTMDYAHVRRRRPIHNRFMPVGP